MSCRHFRSSRRSCWCGLQEVRLSTVCQGEKGAELYEAFKVAQGLPVGHPCWPSLLPVGHPCWLTVGAAAKEAQQLPGPRGGGMLTVVQCRGWEKEASAATGGCRRWRQEQVAAERGWRSPEAGRKNRVLQGPHESPPTRHPGLLVQQEASPVQGPRASAPLLSPAAGKGLPPPSSHTCLQPPRTSASLLLLLLPPPHFLVPVT